VTAVTITGTNFEPSTSLAITGTGVTLGPITVTGSTQLTTSFIIAADAATGDRTVTVSTSAGISNGVTFTVTSPGAPTLTGISPNTGVTGTTVSPVTITGTNFVPTMTLAVSGSGVTLGELKVTSSTQLTTSFTIEKTAATGSRDV